MRFPFFHFLGVAAAFLTTTLTRAADAPAAVTWTLDSLEKSGGATLEIWGSPQLFNRAPASAAAIRFDGKADGLIVPIIPIADWKSFTIEILFSVDADGLAEQRFLHLQDEKGRRVLIELRLLSEDLWCLDTYLHVDADHRLTLIDRTKVHPVGRWHWAALSYADGRMTHFVDGAKECEGAIEFAPMSATGRTSLGVRQNKVSWFKGAIREVRFTPEALPMEKLQRPEKN